MPIKQSFSFWCFNKEGLDVPALFREAKAIGYLGVELLPVELLDTAKDADLTIASHGAHGTLVHGMNKLEYHDRIVSEVRDSIAVAVKYGIPNLICFSGNRDGMSDDEGATNTVACLKDVARDAEQAGIMLVLELLNSKVDHVDYQCDRTPWGVDVVKRVGSPAVKLLYDIYHMQIMEGDVIQTIRDNAQHIGHYHTAGVPGRRDLDDTQELNYPPIVRAIVETGYTGYLGQEFIPKGDGIAALRAAYEVCSV